MSIVESDELMKVTFNGDISRSVVNAVFDRAEGNPFFTEQLTVAMQEAGYIRVIDGLWSFVQIYPKKVVVPARLQSVVTARIDQLSNPQK